LQGPAKGPDQLCPQTDRWSGDRVVYDRKTPTGNILFTIDATITVK